MKNAFAKNNESRPPLDWDFYLYTASALFRWSRQELFDSTPAHFLKQYIKHLTYHNPKALVEDQEQKQIYTLDQTPFM